MKKRFILAGAFAISMTGIVAVSTFPQARFHTIADIPAPDKTPHLQVFVKGENFPAGQPYTLSLQNGDQLNFTISETGTINNSYILPDAISRQEKIALYISEQSALKVDPEDIRLEIDTPSQTLTWAGKFLIPSQKINVSLSGNDGPPPLQTRSDWTGNFTQNISYQAADLIGKETCFEEDLPHGKKLCVAFGIHRSADLIQVVTVGTTTAKQSSDDPFSTFDKWTTPSNCQPYDVELSLCNSSHVSSLQEDLSKTYYDFTRMTLQFSATMMAQAGFIGTLIDGKNQMETQLLLWERQEQAHDDYHPSEQMCAIASMTKELQNSETRRELNTYGIARALEYAEQNPQNHHTAYGGSMDTQFRLQSFKEKHCVPSNDNGALKIFCNGLSTGKFLRQNRDVDFARLIDIPKTLKVDITDAKNSSADEEDVMSMGRLLFGHKVLNMPQPVEDSESKNILNDPDKFLHPYQEYRSISAMRNAARYSFANYVGMKAEGAGSSNLHIQTLMKDFGMPDEDIKRFIGENPSYFAQMHVLTKQIYQHPDFYTNLITKDANIARFQASMEAINLMAGRERFESLLRKEMLLSLLVEMKLRTLQKKVDAGLKDMDSRLLK
ncbi:MAG: hypothetical protein H6855_05770 [Rhodospirillales bacterium]|nr:hypothetical protein [Rhodospirillales bacterium]MCB9965570.1 hypothetical protein [Rhodospirillales bacterium]MCB9979811.1 hypothetical protein [Rhodospirillales bacterium]